MCCASSSYNPHACPGTLATLGPGTVPGLLTEELRALPKPTTGKQWRLTGNIVVHHDLLVPCQGSHSLQGKLAQWRGG